MAYESEVSRRDWVARLSAIGGAVSFAALVNTDSAQGWSGGAGVDGTRLLWVDTIKGRGKNLYSIMGSDVDSNSTPAVIVGAYAVPNDGGGGIFYWDPTSSADDNGGTIVVPRASTHGRWIRQYSGAINANWFGASVPREDLGAVLNACDAALGTSPGQIVVSLVNGIGTEANPATLRTHAVIGAKVALQSCKDGLNADQVAQCKPGRRVTLGPGVYAATTTPVDGETGWHGAPWVIGDNCILEGSGPGTILQESKVAKDGDAVCVIAAYGSIDRYAKDYGNIIIRDLQVVGVPTNPQGAQVAAIYIGNAQNVWINSVTITDTNSFGVYAGDDSGKGGYASGVWITECLFRGVCGQNCGVVNGYDFHIERNTFIGNNPNHPSPGITFIDCETNSSSDRARFFSICDNIIDGRTGKVGEFPRGIYVQGPTTTVLTDVGSGVISGNTCIGGELAEVGGVVPRSGMVIGIYLLNVSNVSVTSNTIIRCRQAGIFLESNVTKKNAALPAGQLGNSLTQYNLIASNLIHGSYDHAIRLVGCSNNRIESNAISGDGTAFFHEESPAGDECSNNTYKENYLEGRGSTPAQLVTQGSAVLINNYLGRIIDFENANDENYCMVGVIASGNAGHGPAYRAVLGNANVRISDYVLAISAGSGNATVTLPSAVHPSSPAAPSQGINQAYILKRTDNSENTLTIATTKGQTIDGAVPGKLTALGTPGATLRVISDGANWLSW
jgi:parallel beta-helix repeat protein